MTLDKIYTLQTGVSLKVSTETLRQLIVRSRNGYILPEFEKIRCTADLYDFLTVTVVQGAEGLIKRRQPWISQKNKADLIAAQPVPFQDFCLFFWRNLDEMDPDGDEWNRAIAADSFNLQLSAVLNKLRIAVQQKKQDVTLIADLNFEPA
ncbi:MAG: hypothetical protein KIS65_06885 [Nitrosomonas sp.]|nr:hypothetical protein [Nitrosomonas sp.]MCW5618918.1 hypothetical protein [Nitrosomonas sp.]